MQEIQCHESGKSCPAFCDGKNLTSVQQSELWSLFWEAPGRPTSEALKQFEREGHPLDVSVRHVNRLRAAWGVSRKKGRPRGQTHPKQHCGFDTRVEHSTTAPLVKMTPAVSYVGVHLFAAWLEEQDVGERIVISLMQVIRQYQVEHPNADFPLLHHKDETLWNRFQALLYAPLFHIGKLTGYDVREHPLTSLIGRGYQSSTLNQFLGQLERIDAGDALLPVLAPKPFTAAETSQAADEHGARLYIDGHMISYWSRVSMHKGKITMLGRIMAGSQAIITHNHEGQAVHVAYQPPDIRMPRFILASCQLLAAAMGIDVFVIDREVNSVELAREFHEAGLGLLTMLDRNQYDGLSSWNVTRIGTMEDGSPVYEGHWATPKPDDPRLFVLVEADERILAYWGTPKVKARLALEQWPVAYRQRTSIQELRFKEMKAYGALDVNFGTKKIWGPDRHQERKREDLAEAADKKAQRLTKKEALLTQQQEKVVESQTKGHTRRLEQRQCGVTRCEQAVEQAHTDLEQAQQKLDAVGTGQQRADRDVRKQLIMTIRTLLLDNLLQGFLGALLTVMSGTISLECLVILLFERSGTRLETESEYIYWINAAGLSTSYRKTLVAIVAGLCAMNLRYQGKPICVCLKDSPP
ncbi:MAG: ATP synthase F0 subunit B [bacterium]|nr:ATP synthase F0 subunit B [bacterium]